MSVTSFYFLVFIAVLLAVYYLVPERLRVAVLLFGGALFIFLSGGNLGVIASGPGGDSGGNLYSVLTAGFTALALIVGECLIVWILTLELSRSEGRIRTLLFCLTLVICIIPLILLKYIGIGGIAAPVGISYYSLTLISMSSDVFLGTAEAERNPFRAMLYGSFFPALTSGPILSYRKDSAELLRKSHPFSSGNITRGLQRMLWGLMKKLVISERLAMVVDSIYSEPASWGAGYLVLGTFCFSFQLYTDFSGCMDIILGVSEALGIRLPENFNRPFLSRTVAEYWRRWHITLGAFMKDYLFYPVLRTGFFSSMSLKLRKSLGKKAGKTVVTAAAMLILWTTVGFWHGGDIKYVIGSGLLHWFYITTGEIVNPVFNKFWKRFTFGPDALCLNVLRVIRTFCLVSIGFVFFRAESALIAAGILGRIFSIARGTLSIGDIGISLKDTLVMLMFLVIMIAVELIADRCPDKDIRKTIASFRLPVRWIIWFALIFAVIIFGKYGPGYDSAAFIYQEF